MEAGANGLQFSTRIFDKETGDFEFEERVSQKWVDRLGRDFLVDQAERGFREAMVSGQRFIEAQMRAKAAAAAPIR